MEAEVAVVKSAQPLEESVNPGRVGEVTGGCVRHDDVGDHLEAAGIGDHAQHLQNEIRKREQPEKSPRIGPGRVLFRAPENPADDRKGKGKDVRGSENMQVAPGPLPMGPFGKTVEGISFADHPPTECDPDCQDRAGLHGKSAAAGQELLYLAARDFHKRKCHTSDEDK